MNTTTKLKEQEFKTELIARYGDWAFATLEANSDLVKSQDTREIGKSRQHSTEYLIIDWLNSLSLNIDVYSQKELEEMKAVGLLPQDFVYDHNESGFDAICIKTGLKFQIKYRGGQTIHLEQTRRNSKKNKGAASKTGHVVYSEGEFDILIAVRPEEISNQFDVKDVIVIDEIDLRCDKNPGFLVRSVSKAKEKKFRAEIKSLGAKAVLKQIIDRKEIVND